MSEIKSENRLVKIQSKIFGLFEVDIDSVIQFPHGIPGLESVQEFAMMTIEEYAPIVWMVSLNGVFHFPLVQYATIDVEDLDETSQRSYKKQLDTYIANNTDEVTYVILKLDQTVTSISLKSPILVNPKKKVGYQLILDQQ